MEIYNFDKIKYPRDGQVVQLFWSNGAETVRIWRFGEIDWDCKPYPIGWLPVKNSEVEDIASQFEYDA